MSLGSVRVSRIASFYSFRIVCSLTVFNVSTETIGFLVVGKTSRILMPLACTELCTGRVGVVPVFVELKKNIALRVFLIGLELLKWPR